MTHEFDEVELRLAHLEQILERLRQEHQQLRAQLVQVEEQQALKRQQHS
ncbi:MAG: V-type ATPase 116kDa subunit family protein, partial [Chloroflexi bacterium]